MKAKQIKIFVDGHVFDKEFQGTQTFLKALYTQLLTRPDLDIYFGARNIENIKKAFPNLPLHHILVYKKRRFDILRLVFDIPFFIREQGFDFAHFQYITPVAIPGCKFIVTLHDILFNDFKKDFSWHFRLSRNLLFGRSLKSAALKTTVSTYSKRRICAYYNLPADAIHVIKNGADKQFQVEKETAIDNIYNKYGLKDFILYVSRIEPRKNHLLLLKTYLKLKLYQQGISLIFIGKASLRVPELTKMIENLNEDQKRAFSWFEQVDQADLTAFYSACKLFVYPSKAEGFGIPPLEAAICGAPVLCSAATAMQDFTFFEPYTFDPANEPVFEQKLSEMISHPPSKSFISSITNYLLEHYNWQQSGASFYNLLKAQS